MKKERVKYCDFLRLWAIVSVIIIHIISNYRQYYVHEFVSGKMYFVSVFIESLTRTGVPLFFMLTGMFLLSSKKEENYFAFIKKKALKLFVPFFLASVCYYLVNVIFYHHPLSIFTFFSDFTTGNIKYHLWFMYTILQMYLLLPFLKKLVQALSKKELRILIFVLFCSSCLTAISHASAVLFMPFFSSFTFSEFLMLSNYLLIGYYLYQYGIPKKYHKILYIFGIFSLIATAGGEFLLSFRASGVTDDFFLNSVSPFIVVMSSAFFVFVQNHYEKFKIGKKMEKGISFVAPMIFFIYMFHLLVVDLFHHYFPKVFAPQTAFEFLGDFFFATLVIVSCSFIVGILCYLIYQEIGKFLVGLKNRKKSLKIL